jgi:hypothetical protein
MGWTLSDDELDPRLNTNPDRPATAGLDPGTLAALREATRVDRAIYDEALRALIPPKSEPATCPTTA